MLEQVHQDAEKPQGEALKRLVESLLFVADGPVPIDSLARALEADRDSVESSLKDLGAEYSTRGFRLQRLQDQVQLVTAPEAGPWIAKFLGVEPSGHLSGAALETLAIIAYRQPVTRPQIEHIRGVNCDAVIHNLLARGLICEVGRLETVGHPILYGPSPEFLQFFGLESLDDLPPPPPDIQLEPEPQDLGELLRGRENGEEPQGG